jgi:hypothetical protein
MRGIALSGVVSLSFIINCQLSIGVQMPKFLPNRQAMVTKVGKEKGDPWTLHLGNPTVPASGAVARVNAGTVVVVTDGPIVRSNLTWWKCRAGGQNGWIAETGLVPLLLASEPLHVDFTSDGYTLRAQPDKNSSAVAHLPAGTPLRAFAMNEPAFSYDYAFWRVTTANNLQGWVATEGLRLSFPTNATVTPMPDGSALRLLRAQPDLQAQPLRSATSGETFIITGGPIANDKKGWWRVRTRDNTEGWMEDGDLKQVAGQG